MACHRQPAASATLAEVQRNASAPASDARIPCATGGQPFADDCTLSREQTPAGLTLTIQRADGSFRRLLATGDGRITAADGAEAARVSAVRPGTLQVALGNDRYRLPATVHAGAR